MSEQSIIERAARALCIEQGFDPDVNMGPLDDPHPHWWFFIKQVEAVLNAIREPNKAMIDAGYSKADDCLDQDWNSNPDGEPHVYMSLRSDAAKPIWQAMIDAALGG